MSKQTKEQSTSGHTPSISKKADEDTLRKLQLELVKLQRHFIKCDDKVLTIGTRGMSRYPGATSMPAATAAS